MGAPAGPDLPCLASLDAFLSADLLAVADVGHLPRVGDIAGGTLVPAVFEGVLVLESRWLAARNATSLDDRSITWLQCLRRGRAALDAGDVAAALPG